MMAYASIRILHHKVKSLLMLIGWVMTSDLPAQSVESLTEAWQKAELKIPNLMLDYQFFINSHLESRTLKAQTKFFESQKQGLEAINPDSLYRDQLWDHHYLTYETGLNLDRLMLIRQTGGSFQGGGIFHEPSGQAWYRYLIRLWTGTHITPEEVTAYGWEEVRRLQNAMAQLEGPMAPPPQATSREEAVEAAFAAYADFLQPRVWQVIPHGPTPPLDVQRGTSRSLSQVPGYYGRDILFYNLFDDPFDLSQVGWLYLHEGIPGHHFQIHSERQANIPAYRQAVSYSGFREGWAAYVEELAHEQAWYQNSAQRMSQMKWDLIRSIRLVLDTGINHEGWSDEKAMEVWRSVLPDDEPIGRREIARVRRWPAQVLTYKIGAKIILDTRKEALGDDQSDKALRAFHSRLLSKGSIPMALVPALFNR